jgi:MscS family membrane protein
MASIQNISARHRILHRQILRLALDTSDSKIKALLEVLRAALESNKNVTQDDWRVRFVEFGEYSKNVEVFAYIETTNWRDFLAISEDINLQTAAALRSVGVALAVPVLPG